MGSGWLERKEVIACVVITRGGSPNGSRRVARRAAASLDHNLTVRIDQVVWSRASGLVESCFRELDFIQDSVRWSVIR